MNRRRDEKKARKRAQRQHVNHGILKVGKVLFAPSDSEDEDPNREYYVSDRIVEAAGNRSYTMTLEQMVNRRD